MKEHAIPQDITGYKFHIVGNMTLKQFAEVAIGVVVAFFIFKTNLIDVVKWFLILLSAGGGAAMAFLPIEERPLDHWLTTFISILYKPTKFYWKKTTRVPDAFTFNKNSNDNNTVSATNLAPQRRERISEYLKSVDNTNVLDEEDLLRKQRSDQLLAIFGDQTLKTDLSGGTKMNRRPKLKVEARSLAGDKDQIGIGGEAANQNDTQVTAPVAVTKLVNLEPLIEDTVNQNQAAKTILTTTEVASEIEIPMTPDIKVEKTFANNPEIRMVTTEELEQTQTAAMSRAAAEPGNNPPATSATINKDLPFPIKPTKANKLVGMILTRDDELVNHATVSLKSSNGQPVTAVKSNALGQFFITSQLPNDTYTITITAPDLTFEPLQIVLEGKIINPLEIRSNE